MNPLVYEFLIIEGIVFNIIILITIFAWTLAKLEERSKRKNDTIK